MRIAVLISGSGSNLQAILDRFGQAVVLVISNEPQAYGLTRAKIANVPTAVCSHSAYADREAFEAALLEKLDAARADLVVLAGFMRILGPTFVNSRYKGRILNIHPALLPKYKGLNTHAAVMAAGEKRHGATVHFVTESLDSGPIIAQVRLGVYPEDTVDTLAARVLAQEHRIYPEVIEWFYQGRLSLAGNQAILDKAPLPPEGVQL